jgi:hypothetical protein
VEERPVEERCIRVFLLLLLLLLLLRVLHVGTDGDSLRQD